MLQQVAPYETPDGNFLAVGSGGEGEESGGGFATLGLCLIVGLASCLTGIGIGQGTSLPHLVPRPSMPRGTASNAPAPDDASVAQPSARRIVELPAMPAGFKLGETAAEARARCMSAEVAALTDADLKARPQALWQRGPHDNETSEDRYTCRAVLPAPLRPYFATTQLWFCSDRLLQVGVSTSTGDALPHAWDRQVEKNGGKMFSDLTDRYGSPTGTFGDASDPDHGWGWQDSETGAGVFLLDWSRSTPGYRVDIQWVSGARESCLGDSSKAESERRKRAL